MNNWAPFVVFKVYHMCLLMCYNAVLAPQIYHKKEELRPRRHQIPPFSLYWNHQWRSSLYYSAGQASSSEAPQPHTHYLNNAYFANYFNYLHYKNHRKGNTHTQKKNWFGLTHCAFKKYFFIEMNSRDWNSQA